LVVFLNYFGVT